jgi:hypothetical protein
MCIITAPYAVVYPLAVVIASIDTIVALRGGLAFAWYVYWMRCIPLCSDSTVEVGKCDKWSSILRSPWRIYVNDEFWL